MFTITSTQKFQLYTEAINMRKSFDGLSGLVNDFIEDLPVGLSVFVFINKKRDKLKILHWSGSGYLLYYKRLEEGTFELPRHEIKQSLIQLSYTLQSLYNTYFRIL